MRGFIIILFFCSCNSVGSNTVYLISGTVDKIPASKIYFTESHRWNIFIDSADYKNNQFEFRISSKIINESFTASISYLDSNDKKIKTLYYRNHILSPAPDSTKYLTNFFVVDTFKIFISGENGSFNQLDIIASSETNAMFSTQMFNFGYVDNGNSDSRRISIDKYKKIIYEYPASYYLFNKIIDNKELYTGQELSAYLECFTKEIQNSTIASKLLSYIRSRPSFESGIENKVLKTVSGIKRPIISDSSNITMLVFWASWCAPCRAEIPVLKKLFKELREKGFAISSISIDEDEEKWRSALAQENMPWKQFILDKAEIEKTKKEYDFSAIPFAMVTTNKGKVLLRTVGFDANKTYDEQKEFFENLLKDVQ